MCKPNAAGSLTQGSNNPNWKGGPITINCLVCGKEVKVRPGYANRKYCSMQCVGKSQTKGVTAWVDKPCKVCGKPFRVRTSQQESNQCCSEDCTRINRSNQFRGKNNVNWKGGVNHRVYTHDWDSVSKRVRRRDGNKCLNPKCTHDAKLSVHHIDTTLRIMNRQTL